MIEEVVEAFKLNKSQILCLVVNNASNMTKTVERLNKENKEEVAPDDTEVIDLETLVDEGDYPSQPHAHTHTHTNTQTHTHTHIRTDFYLDADLSLLYLSADWQTATIMIKSIFRLKCA